MAPVAKVTGIELLLLVSLKPMVMDRLVVEPMVLFWSSPFLEAPGSLAPGRLSSSSSSTLEESPFLK